MNLTLKIHFVSKRSRIERNVQETKNTFTSMTNNNLNQFLTLSDLNNYIVFLDRRKKKKVPRYFKEKKNAHPNYSKHFID